MDVSKDRKNALKGTDVFSGIRLGNVALKNRFVRSATWEGMATEDGVSTPRLAKLMQNLAEGGTGLLISSHAYVQKAGQAGPWQLGIHDDAVVPGLREMCEGVHRAGGVIFAQLAHAGANANASLSGLQPLAPTATSNVREEASRTMSEEDIAELIGAFEKAARRALEAGFDGIQIHAAHGYGLSQFLSPYYNKRTDRYGGGAENRARLLIEVYRAVRKLVGEAFPVAAKLNADDFLDGGVAPEMMAETAAIMENAGFDAIELSGGGGPKARYISSRSFDPKTPEEEGYYRNAARLYKDRVKIPLMFVGGIRSLEGARQLMDEGLADMISLCRPLIREPGLVKRWTEGDTRRSACISCDACRKPAGAGEGLRCVLEDK